MFCLNVQYKNPLALRSQNFTLLYRHPTMFPFPPSHHNTLFSFSGPSPLVAGIALLCLSLRILTSCFTSSFPSSTQDLSPLWSHAQQAQPISCQNSLWPSDNNAQIADLNYLPLSDKDGIYWAEGFHASGSRYLYHFPARQYLPASSYEMARMPLPAQTTPLAILPNPLAHTSDTSFTPTLHAWLAQDDSSSFQILVQDLVSQQPLTTHALPLFLWADGLRLNMAPISSPPSSSSSASPSPSSLTLFGYTDAFVWAVWPYSQASIQKPPSSKLSLDPDFRYIGHAQEVHFFAKTTTAEPRHRYDAASITVHIKQHFQKASQTWLFIHSQLDLPLTLKHPPLYKAFFPLAKDKVILALIEKTDSASSSPSSPGLHPHKNSHILHVLTLNTTTGVKHSYHATITLHGDYHGQLQFFRHHNTLYLSHFSWLYEAKILHLYPLHSLYKHTDHTSALHSQTFGPYPSSAVITHILSPLPEQPSTLHMLMRTKDSSKERSHQTFSLCSLELSSTTSTRAQE